MWPKLLDMSKDECKRLLRRTELEAYAGLISALRAQGDLTKDKKHLLNELAATLSISTERHRAEVRRAVNDEKLSTVAERLSGPNNSSEWSIEGRRLIPLMPRLVPQTVFSLTANQAANAAFSHNLTLPLPSETAKKEAPSGSENSGASMKLASPSSNVIVLPSGLSIPIKGGPEPDMESSVIKKSRRDSGNPHPMEAGSSSIPAQAMQPSSSIPSSMLHGSAAKSPTGHVITTNRSLSLPSTKHHTSYTLPGYAKQHGGKSMMSRLMSPAGLGTSSVAIKGGNNSAQSPLKFTFAKTTTSAGITTPTCSAQKVILVSSSSTSFTPSILQRSHSAPSSKSPLVKPGPKQSVILTSVGGQSSMSRQAEMVSSGKHTGASPRQHPAGVASITRQTIPARHHEMTSGHHMTPSDPTQGSVTSLASSGKKPSGNMGMSSINSTVITARTTASVITSHMASYVSPNMAGKPRGRAVSKQKLLKQVNVSPTFSGDPMASRNQPMRVPQDAGTKIITQSVATSTSKQQRSSGQVNTTETTQKVSMATTQKASMATTQKASMATTQKASMATTQKASMATATMATGKASNVMAGHKVIISTTSAGVTPHHVAMATPLIRTRPSGTVGSVGAVASKTVAGGTKLVSSGIVGSTGVNNPKLMQTIKATTTANVSQTVAGVTQVINSKPSLVMHKCFSSSPQTILTEPAKQPQAHNIASSLLQRPRISMITGVPTTTAASNFSPSSIRFPVPQTTSGITMTTVKSSGSKRMRSPITMVTGPTQSVQRRPVAPNSPNPTQGIMSSGTTEDTTMGKQVIDNAMSVKRGILGSCSHPNSEWIDYDGHLPDTSASSAIKALLEFRSLPDAAKLSPTIDLSLIGSPASKSHAPVTQPASQCTTAPSRPSQPALMTTRIPHHIAERTTVGSPLEGFSKFSPALLSNVQSRLKEALMSERTVKPASAASLLQTATMEVEKALQEQNKALLAKQEGSTKYVQPENTQDGTPRSTGPSELTAAKKTQSEKGQPLNVTVEEQGVVTERLNLSSEDVSSFVDQFEQFLESETFEDKQKGTVSSNQHQAPSDRSSGSKPTGKPVETFQLQSRPATSKSPVASAEAIDASDWSADSANQSADAELTLPIWSNKVGLETIVTSGKKGAASVVMESGSVDITQMKIEDFTSQRLQDVEDTDEDKDGNLTSPDSSPALDPSVGSPNGGSGSEELLGVRISGRKRKAPAPIDEEPGPTSMSSWARTGFNLLQRVMRFRGASRSKGDLNAASWFTRPVAAAEAPGYNKVIKNPMDFGTVKRKLESGQYDDFPDFHSDMMLVHNNCVQYNPPGHEIRRDCEEVFQFYTAEYAKLMERWERPSPKKPKPDDLLGDKTKPAAARCIILK